MGATAEWGLQETAPTPMQRKGLGDSLCKQGGMGIWLVSRLRHRPRRFMHAYISTLIRCCGWSGGDAGGCRARRCRGRRAELG